MTMNVAELIAELSKFQENLPVAVSSDAEGNDFGWLADVETSFYRDFGYGALETVHPDDVEEDEEPDTAVILWPL